jgi:hypothetical protein
MRATSNVWPPPPRRPSHYLTFTGVEFVNLSDHEGNTSAPGPDGWPTRRVPNTGYFQLGERAVMLSLPAVGEYLITFQTTGRALSIEALCGLNNYEPDSVVRYKDLRPPAGVAARMRVSGAEVGELLLDLDGTGEYGTRIDPTHRAAGVAARDRTPPTVIIRARAVGCETMITVDAIDDESGVQEVRYSTDGLRFRTYTGPVLLDAASTRIIYAFADDKVGNRSACASLRLRDTPEPASSRDTQG